jgi:hypothetical protein
VKEKLVSGNTLQHGASYTAKKAHFSFLSLSLFGLQINMARTGFSTQFNAPLCLSHFITKYY